MSGPLSERGPAWRPEPTRRVARAEHFDDNEAWTAVLEAAAGPGGFDGQDGVGREDHESAGS